MTHGGFIYFKNINNKNNEIKILKNFNFFNLYLFKIKIFRQNKIFYRINIKSKKIISKNHISESKYLFYDKKNNINKKNPNTQNNKIFLRNIKFIKSTGIHSNEGILFHKKINDKLLEKKIIHNKKIFNIIRNFYNL